MGFTKGWFEISRNDNVTHQIIKQKTEDFNAIFDKKKLIVFKINTMWVDRTLKNVINSNKKIKIQYTEFDFTKGQFEISRNENFTHQIIK